jgi:hypothetical protein
VSRSTKLVVLPTALVLATLWGVHGCGAGEPASAGAGEAASGRAVVTPWQPFAVAGRPLAGVLLYPGGAPVPINLVFTNRAKAPITVRNVTVTVTGTDRLGCAANNFTLARQLTAQPVVPADSTETLHNLGVPQSQWPQLQMLYGGRQDVCMNATVNLAFAGSANR